MECPCRKKGNALLAGSPDVRGPSMVVRLPLDPPIENRTSARSVAKHLFHVDELEPELVHPAVREYGGGAEGQCVCVGGGGDRAGRW